MRSPAPHSHCDDAALLAASALPCEHDVVSSHRGIALFAALTAIAVLASAFSSCTTTPADSASYIVLETGQFT